MRFQRSKTPVTAAVFEVPIRRSTAVDPIQAERPTGPIPGTLNRSTVRGRVILSAFLLCVMPKAGICFGQPSQGLFPEAFQAFYQGDFQKARNFLQDHLRKLPKDEPARVLLARTLASQGEYDAAISQLAKVLEANPKNVDALYFLGALSGALSQFEFQKMYRLASDSPRVHFLMGQALEAEGKIDEAELEYEKVLAKEPGNVDALVAAADILRTKTEIGRAREFYTRALQQNPNDYRSVYGLGACYHQSEEFARAGDYFRRTIELAPDYAAAHFAMGSWLLRMNNPSGALQYLEKAVALEPEMDQAYLLLGRAYQALGETEKAQSALATGQALLRKNRAAKESRYDRMLP